MKRKMEEPFLRCYHFGTTLEEVEDRSSDVTFPGTYNSTQVSANAPPLSRLTPRRATALESDAAARANKFRAVLAAQVGLEFLPKGGVLFGGPRC